MKSNKIGKDKSEAEDKRDKGDLALGSENEYKRKSQGLFCPEYQSREQTGVQGTTKTITKRKDEKRQVDWLVLQDCEILTEEN